MRRIIELSLFLFSLSAMAGYVPNQARIRTFFKHSSVMTAPYDNVVDSRPVKGMGQVLHHSLRDYRIAKDEGRIFVNFRPVDLPKGAYTFVILADGSLIFGRDDGTGTQVGIRHFVLAQGADVVAAGEYKDGRFNLNSSTYVDAHDEVFPGFKDELKGRVQEVFTQLSRKPIEYTTARLLPNRPTLETKDFKRYCRNPSFYNAYQNTLCREIRWECEAALAGP